MKISNNQILPAIGVSLFALVILNPGISFAQAIAQLDNWQFNPKTQQLKINLSATVKPQYFYLAEPPRLVLDLPNTKLGKVATQGEHSGAIQKIRISQMNANVTRIVLDLAPGTQLQSNQIQLLPLSPQKPTRWVLNPHITFSPAKSLYGGTTEGLTGQPRREGNHGGFAPTLMTTLPPSTTLTTNLEQPFITVPPLNSQNPSSIPSSPLPSAMFPKPSVNKSNSPNKPTEIPIIEFGQPLPKNL
ncbi:AMIN domain-containing protein [Dolichospermum sp. FACHB-1091]|uniref:AMIN domain-containing protein n=1 Tax=Dolichospermum sp. FACHB-1091 TaxID=2692798 RepID=UPI00168011AA|nr:AMIN domain-containing protein [Dolichospermum sp. FACHB-1091]MBD2442911.1 AMIN domain-containing protein [Dolichospermum sp. FACHB-1091]